MTVEQTLALNIAYSEYEEDGMVSTTAYMALTATGLDADSVLTSIEEAYYGRS